MRTFLAAAAFTFALSTGAVYAQYADGTSNMMSWMSGPNAYNSMMIQGSPDDARARFGTLSAEERQYMRDECLSSVAAHRSNAVVGSVDTMTTASITPDRTATFASMCQDVNAW
jgi:hypothetical protein